MWSFPLPITLQIKCSTINIAWRGLHDLALWTSPASSLSSSLMRQVLPSLCLVLSHSVLSHSLQPHGLQPTGSSIHGNSPGKSTGVGCHALLQGIFPTQGSNPGLPHFKQILYWLSSPGRPYWTSRSYLRPFHKVSLLLEMLVLHSHYPPNFKSQLKCYFLKEISLTSSLSQFSLYITTHNWLYLPHVSCFPRTNSEAPQ